MNVKEAFEDFAKRIEGAAYMEASSKAARALDRVAQMARETVAEIDDVESPHATTQAEWRKGYEVLEGRVRDFQNDATRFRSERDAIATELARTKAERDAFQQAARNAQEDAKLRIASDLSACREAAEGLRAQPDNALAEVERLKGCLLTPEEAKEIVESYRVLDASMRLGPTVAGGEIRAVQRATRPA